MTSFAVPDSIGTPGPAWSLDKATFRDIIERVTIGTTTKLQRCRHYTIIRSRRGYGITSIRPSNRTSAFQFDLVTGPTTSVRVSWIGGSSRKFICTFDDTDVINKETGEAVQVQYWEHYSKFKDIPGSDFGTIEDEDANPPSEDEDANPPSENEGE